MPGERLPEWAARIAAGLRRLPDAAARTVTSRGPRILSAFRDAVGHRSGGSAASFRLDTRTGQVTVSSEHPGVVARETGATLRGHPWLAVPVGPARDTTRRAGGPRSDVPLFLLVARDGRRFLATHRGGSIELRWKLQPTVQVKRHPVLAAAFDRATRGLDADLIATAGREVGPG